jgi:hypothetical protein
MEKNGFHRSLSSAEHPPHDKIPGSLPEYIDELRECGCSDERDRIFSLLSIAAEIPRIEVGYEVCSLILFCAVLGTYGDEKSIDDLLVLGTHLVEALDVQVSDLSQGGYTAFDLETNYIRMNLTAEHVGCAVCRIIAIPAWTNGPVKLYEESSDRYQAPLLMLCVYVAVYDVENIHVLEYAVTEDKSVVIVRYARTFEFIRGCPESLLQDGMFVKIQGEDSQRHPAQWLSVLSEDV